MGRRGDAEMGRRGDAEMGQRGRSVNWIMIKEVEGELI